VRPHPPGENYARFVWACKEQILLVWGWAKILELDLDQFFFLDNFLKFLGGIEHLELATNHLRKYFNINYLSLFFNQLICVEYF